MRVSAAQGKAARQTAPERYYLYKSRVPFEEDDRREFKAGFTSKGFPALLAKYVVSFLNSRGGTIYFGIEDDSNVCGV